MQIQEKQWPIIVRVLCLELVLAHGRTGKGGTAVKWWLLGVAGVAVRLSLPRLKCCFTSYVPSWCWSWHNHLTNTGLRPIFGNYLKQRGENITESAYMLWSVSLTESYFCGVWKLLENGKSPEHCIEVLSDSREYKALLLCRQWRDKQPGSWDRCCSQGWLAVSQLHAGAALV